MTDYKKRYLQSKKQYIKQKAGMYNKSIRTSDDVRRENIFLENQIKELKNDNIILNKQLNDCKNDIYTLTNNLRQLEEQVQKRLEQYLTHYTK